MAESGGADPAVSLRRLRPDDAEAYRALRLEALERHPDSFGATFETEAAETLAWFAERLERNTVFGAWRDDALLGVAGFNAQPGAKQRHKGRLWGVYVRPAGRGAGLGRALVERVLAHARSEVELIQLTVTAGNGQARRLYAELGFVEYGIDRRGLKYDGAYIDEVLMVKFF